MKNQIDAPPLVFGSTSENDAYLLNPEPSVRRWSPEEREHAEYLVFNSSDWAHEADSELLELFAEPQDGAVRGTEAFAQARATREQFRAIAVQQSLKGAGKSVRDANRQLCAITAQLAQEIGLELGAMDRVLFKMALSRDTEWPLGILLDRAPHLSCERITEGYQPGHWPLTMLAGSWAVGAIKLLIQHGAEWSEDGKKVLTGIAWDHPRHPAQSLGYSANPQPWWANFFNDERHWSVFSTNAAQTEFDAQLDGPLAAALVRDPESQDALSLVKMLARGMAEQVAWGREADTADANAEQNKKPSREALIAEIYLSKKKARSFRQDAQKAYADLAALGLDPTELEQEAIWALRARFGLQLSDLPSTWTPNVGTGQALWALFSQSRWIAGEKDDAGQWNSAGAWVVKEAKAFLALAKAQKRDPLEEWLGAAARRMQEDARPGREEASARSALMLGKLDATLSGALSLVDQFPDFAPKQTAGWSKKLAESVQITPKEDSTERRKSQEEAVVLQHEVMVERKLREWESLMAARSKNVPNGAAGESCAPSKKTLRL